MDNSDSARFADPLAEGDRESDAATLNDLEANTTLLTIFDVLLAKEQLVVLAVESSLVALTRALVGADSLAPGVA
jgi:hypothetical protein